MSLSLLVLAISFIIPKQSGHTKLFVKNELDTLFATCSLLQQRAIASNIKQELVFSVTTHLYWYKGIALHKRRGSKKVHTLSSHVRFAQPTKKIKRPITFPNNTITFLPSGYISPGAVYLTDKTKTHVMALTCPVSQVSMIRWYG